MENISAAVFETMVNSFTDADELLKFAMTWGLLESPAVRLRLFQLRNAEYSGAFVNEQLTIYFNLWEGRRHRMSAISSCLWSL